MSLLAQFIGPCSAFLLVSYLSGLTTEVHAQAALDSWMETETKIPLETTTHREKTVSPTTETYTSKAKDCSSMPRLDFAQPRDEFLGQTTFSTGAKVFYNCRPGYIRIPGSLPYAICNYDGTWLFSGTFCTRRSCGNPGDADNAEMEAQDFLFGSKVTYNCNHGYRMVSRRDYRECLADGTWSNALPICEAQLCPQPSDIIDGGFIPVKEEYAYLDSVTYFCYKYLALIGDGTISCMENGQWSSNAPQCRLVQCPDPYVTNARKLTGISGPYNLNTVVRFRCYSNYMLNGSDIVKCNENSKWEPALPKCLDFCRFTPSIKYAYLLEPPSDKYVDGTTLTFKCKEGFNPVPGASNVLTCEGNLWSQHAEFCTPVFCGHPGTISNGHIADGSFYFDSNVTFACNTGYKFEDRNYRACQANGSWSFPIPECTVQTCPHSNISLGTLIIPVKPQYQYKDTVTLSCHEEYQLTGSSQSVCNHEGKWEPALASCKSICYAPPELEFAELRYKFNNTITEDETVEYTCKNGYSRNSQYMNTLKCLGYYEWSQPERFCSRIYCGLPEGIRHGSYQLKDFYVGSEAIYKCIKGYKLVSEISTRKCLATKTWSGPAPRCRVQTCPPPVDIVNGSFNNTKNIYIYRDSVTYKCHNLTIVGETSITCTADGNWTSEAPECKAVCKSPPQLKYGELIKACSQMKYFEVGKTLKYKCRPGYVAVENKSNEVTCLNDFTWTKPEVFCERLKCDNPGNIAHGLMHSENFLFESRVNYTCMPGYSMISRRNYRLCQADGTWSGTPPVCKASICDNIWELQEETRKCTSTPEDWMKYLQVQLLYLQIENLKLDIEIKKRKLLNAEESITLDKREDH